MKMLVRHRPVNDLLNEFDRLFAHNTPVRRTEEANNWGLPIDVAEKDETYIVQASLPGVDPEAIEVTMEEDLLTIQAEIKTNEAVTGNNYHIRERRQGQFGRTIRFPVPVLSDAIEATYKHGVLTLTIPKAEEVKPKRIAIKNGVQ